MTWESGFGYNQLSTGIEQCICKDVLSETHFYLFSNSCCSRIAENVLDEIPSLSKRYEANKNFKQLCSDIFDKYVHRFFTENLVKIVRQKCQRGAFEKFNGVHTE